MKLKCILFYDIADTLGGIAAILEILSSSLDFIAKLDKIVCNLNISLALYLEWNSEVNMSRYKYVKTVCGCMEFKISYQKNDFK